MAGENIISNVHDRDVLHDIEIFEQENGKLLRMLCPGNSLKVPDKRQGGVMGGLLNDSIAIYCGGKAENFGFQTCYQIGKTKPFANLKHDRYSGAELVLENSILWVTGGDKSPTDSTLDTTEYVFSTGRVEDGPKLPRRAKRHCLVQLGNDDIMLIGGMAQVYTG